MFCISAHVFLLIYGFIGSLYFGGYVFFDNPRIFQYMSVSLVFTIILVHSFIRQEAISDSRSHYIIGIYFIIGICYIISVGALQFKPLPNFYFKSYTEILEYSAETTMLLCLASLFFIVNSANFKSLIKYVSIILSLLFYFLSFYAGSRGEVLISQFLIFLAVLRLYTPKQSFSLVLAFAALTLLTFENNLIFDESIPKYFMKE